MLIENHGSEAQNRPDFRDHQRSDVEKTKKVDGFDRTRVRFGFHSPSTLDFGARRVGDGVGREGGLGKSGRGRREKIEK